MTSGTQGGYTLLEKEEVSDCFSDPLLPKDVECGQEMQPTSSAIKKKHERPGIWLIQVSTILLALTLSFLAGWRLHSSKLPLESVWDELGRNIRYKKLSFEPHFEGPKSPYMGVPNAVVDARWYNLAKLRHYAVEHSTLAKINRTKAAVQFPATSKFQVGLEAFHQLHCLNYVRMYTYKSYYEKIDFDMVAESAEESLEHKDHCIDILRQRLMCNPDLNIYTYHWVNDHDLPVANLRTPHQCVDWDHFYGWAEEHAFHSKSLSPPPGVEMLPSTQSF